MTSYHADKPKVDGRTDRQTDGRTDGGNDITPSAEVLRGKNHENQLEEEEIGQYSMQSVGAA